MYPPTNDEMKQDFNEMIPGHQNSQQQKQQHKYNHDEYLKAFAGYKGDDQLKKQLKALAVTVFVVTLGLVVVVNYHKDLEKRMFTHEPSLGPGATQAAPQHHHVGGLGGSETASHNPHAQLQMQMQAAQGRIPAAQMPYPAHQAQLPPGGQNGFVQAPAAPYGFNQPAMPPSAMMPNGVYSVPMTRPGEMLPPCLVVPIQDTHGNFRVKRIVGR